MCHNQTAKILDRCDKCGYEINRINFNRHYNSCKGIGPHSTRRTGRKYKKIEDRPVSFFEDVQKYYNDSHSWRDVISEFKISWNGIIKSIKLGYLATRTSAQTSELRGSNISNPNRKHTEETKRKISKSRIKYLEENPEKVPYVLNHASKGPSYPERYWKKIFDKYDVNYSEQYKVGRFSLDFAFPENLIYIEIDGEQHYTDKRIVESDKIRTMYLNNLGWKVIRVRWSHFMRMKIDERKKFVKDLINQLKILSMIPSPLAGF